MKKIIVFFIIFLLSACASSDNGLDQEYKEFVTEYNGTFAIFPTYEHIGIRDIKTSGADRTFHVWKEDSSGKYIMLHILKPAEDVFPEDVNWINTESAIYHEGNVAAYEYLAARPASTIEMLDKPLPECYVVAQRFSIDKERKEAVYRIFVVPDETCLLMYEDAINELDRVVIKRR